MQWSKLKTRIKALICPELRSRVDFHVTSYRGSHDEAEKAWITLDGERVLTCSWYRYQWDGWPRDSKGRLLPKPLSNAVFNYNAFVHQPQEMGRAMRIYLSLPVQDAVRSDDQFVRALAILDRRVGARTLRSLVISESEHPLVKSFYSLRLEAVTGPAKLGTLREE